MKHRPWILIVLALGHILAPFVNLIFDAIWAQAPVLYYVHIFFQPHNFSRHWFHFFAPIAAGIAIYLCRRWSYLVYVAFMAALAFVSYASFLSRTDSHAGPWPLITVYFVNFLIVTYFLLPAVRKVYFDPRLRWWETMPRYNVSIRCHFSVVGTNPLRIYEGTVANFSQTGLFLKAPDTAKDHEIIQIDFSYEDHPCQLQGQVIHHARQDSHGFGVQFLHNPGSRKMAKLLAARLQAQGFLQTERAMSQEDTFSWWIHQLFKTGKGLIPNIKKYPTK